MPGLPLQFASCSPHNSVHLCEEAGRQKTCEGSRIIVMTSSEDFDNNLRRIDNCADSLMLLSSTSGALKRRLYQVENESRDADFLLILNPKESLDNFFTAGLYRIYWPFFQNQIFAPVKKQDRFTISLSKTIFHSFYKTFLLYIKEIICGFVWA